MNANYRILVLQEVGLKPGIDVACKRLRQLQCDVARFFGRFFVEDRYHDGPMKKKKMAESNGVATTSEETDVRVSKLCDEICLYDSVGPQLPFRALVYGTSGAGKTSAISPRTTTRCGGHQIALSPNGH